MNLPGRRPVRISGVVLTLCSAVSSFAGLIQTSGAGALPGSAEDLTGLSPTEITGTLDGNDLNDVNMFKIQIFDPLAFSAFTNALAFGIPTPFLVCSMTRAPVSI